MEIKLVSFENFKPKANLHEATYNAYNVGGLIFHLKKFTTVIHTCIPNMKRYNCSYIQNCVR